MMTEMEPAAIEFIERMGLATEAEGLPRIAGRLLGYLLLYQGPATFDELMEALKVSRGSVSTNTRMLEQLGVIERVTRPGERQAYFQLSDDPFRHVMSRQVERLRKAREITLSARVALGDEIEGAQERLADLQAFQEFTIRKTEATLEAWRAEREATDD